MIAVLRKRGRSNDKLSSVTKRESSSELGGEVMKKLGSFILLGCLIVLAGCNSKYADEDVAAIVRGEEITVGELRFLYEDDKIPGYLDGTIKAKLAEQEAKKMNLDVSNELQEIQETKSTFIDLFLSKENDSDAAKANRKLVDAQAKKMGMKPEEYLEKHYEAISETNVYMLAYVASMIGQPMIDDEDFDMEEYNVKGNQVLDKLVEDNEEEIKKIIK